MKKSMYANIIRKGDERLIHNSLFGGIVKASCSNSKTFLDRIDEESFFEINDNENFHQTLKDMRMIVEDDVNESNLANFYYESNQRRELFIILFVTKQCNFRCVYCSQKHEDKIMTYETYDDILDAIEKLIDAYGYRIVRLSFFGGEPLLEYDKICKFSEEVNDLAERKNVIYVAGMTTNGYLLTSDRLEKLVGVKIIDYQITLDGLKEKHDKARLLVGKNIAHEISNWEVIMKNLINAKSSSLGFSFLIRTNFDDEIISSSTEFVEHLSNNFKNDPRFMFHFEAVKNLSGSSDVDFDLVDDEVACVHEIASKADKAGLKVYSTQTVVRSLGMSCYATSYDSFAIDYDGTLMKCTVHVDSEKNRIGSVSDKKISINDHLMALWTSPGLSEKCKSCRILPICYNKKCPIAGSDDNPCERLANMYENALKMLI